MLFVARSVWRALQQWPGWARGVAGGRGLGGNLWPGLEASNTQSNVAPKVYDSMLFVARPVWRALQHGGLGGRGRWRVGPGLEAMLLVVVSWCWCVLQWLLLLLVFVVAFLLDVVVAVGFCWF